MSVRRQYCRPYHLLVTSLAKLCKTTLHLYLPSSSMLACSSTIPCQTLLSMLSPMFVEQGVPIRHLLPFQYQCSLLIPREYCKSYAQGVPAAVPVLPSMGSASDVSIMLVLLAVVEFLVNMSIKASKDFSTCS